MNTFTPHSTGLYLAMTFNTIWGSLRCFLFPIPSNFELTKTLNQKPCILEQLNGSITDVCILALSHISVKNAFVGLGAFSK
jgi:hypothetical protein